MRFIEVCLENRKENSGGESMLKLLRYNFREGRIAYSIEFIVLFLIDAAIFSIGLYQKAKGIKIFDINFYPGIVSIFSYVNTVIIMSLYQRQLTQKVGGLYFSTQIRGTNYLLSKVVEYLLVQGAIVLIQTLFSYIFKTTILLENSSAAQDILFYTMHSIVMFDLIVFLMTIFVLVNSKLQDYPISILGSLVFAGFAGIAGLIVNHNLVKLLPQFVMNINMSFYSKESYLNIFLGAFVRDGVLNINLLTLFIKLGLYIALIFIAGRAMDKKLNMSFNG